MYRPGIVYKSRRASDASGRCLRPAGVEHRALPFQLAFELVEKSQSLSQGQDGFRACIRDAATRHDPLHVPYPSHLALPDCHLSSESLKGSVEPDLLNLSCSSWTNGRPGFSCGAWEARSMTRADADEKPCPTCKGTGRSLLRRPAPMGRRPHPTPCDNCAGKGRVPAHTSQSEPPSERRSPLSFG